MAKITKQRLEEIVQKALNELDEGPADAAHAHKANDPRPRSSMGPSRNRPAWDAAAAAKKAADAKKPEEKAHGDVTRSLTKIDQVPGLEALLQRVDNIPELTQFLVKMLETPGLRKDVDVAEIKVALTNALRKFSQAEN